MKPTVSIGTQSFEFLRKHQCFFVDKTAFIKEWWENNDNITLITRPRRFGKTLNLNMLECFFSNRFADRADLFEGLCIWDEEKYRLLQGTYPIISFSFANIKGSTYETAHESILQTLTELYSNHAYLLNENVLTTQEAAYFSSVSPQMTDAAAAISLYRLSLYLSRYYGQKVLILLDEYDTPLQEAYVYGYWKELTDFIRLLFNSTFKSNPYMERGLMTGITSVSKESIFSDLNNLEVITTTTEKYMSSFGFTEKEVMDALEEFGLSGNFDKVKYWYDGFRFGTTADIYNPWSITKYLDRGKFGTYWANTSSNKLVGKLLREGTPDLKIAMEDLLTGKQIAAVLDEEIIFDQLDEDDGAIWSLLLASGYLKVIDVAENEDENDTLYFLSLTNLEVKKTFQKMIQRWFHNTFSRYNDFLKALLANDVDYMNQYMNQIASLTFSSFDTGNKPSERAEPERFYHGFVLGLIVDLADQYRITSNRESGLGRYDVIMEPQKENLMAFVFEFKVFNPAKEKTLNDTLKNALSQITQKRYDTDLIAKGIPKERIQHYGFAFSGKNVLIG